jgi:hypothetical protein
LAVDIELFGEKLLQLHFVQHKSHPGANPALRGEKPTTNRLSYDMAYFILRQAFKGI